MSHLDFDIVSDLGIRISCLCYINSTNYYVRIYKQFMQNKPNFPYFSTENEDYAKKQTQFKPKFIPDVSSLDLAFTLGCAYLYSAGGRGQTQFVKILIPLTMAYVAAIFDFLGFFVVKVYKDTGRLKVVVEDITAGLLEFVNLTQRKSDLYYLGKLFLSAPAVLEIKVILQREKMLKSIYLFIVKSILTVILFIILFLPCGCKSYEQIGETAAEGHRRHLRVHRINQQQLMADLDKFFLLDKPSKLTDKRIP